MLCLCSAHGDWRAGLCLPFSEATEMCLERAVLVFQLFAESITAACAGCQTDFIAEQTPEFFKQGFKDTLPCSVAHAELIAT